MSQREEFLRQQGYEEPFDKSPVEVPAGWHGGDVRNTVSVGRTSWSRTGVKLFTELTVMTVT